MRRPVTLVLALVLVAGACRAASSPTTTVPAGDAAPLELPGGFDLQGHRGARGLKPENTLPSFETALDYGVTTLELDLHLTADDEVVIWHDATVDPRKCRRDEGAPADVPDPDDPATPDVELAIRALSTDQLGWYQCDRNPDPSRFPDQAAGPTPVAGDGYEIVALGELFSFVDRYTTDAAKTALQRDAARHVRFNIETKRKPSAPHTIDDGFDGVNPGVFERRLLDVIDAYGMAERVTIQSFDIRSLAAIHSIEPDVPLAMLTSGGGLDFEAYVAAGATVWSPNADQVDVDTVTRAHAQGLDVIPWTVNDRERAQVLIALGVDGLITDRPDGFDL